VEAWWLSWPFEISFSGILRMIFVNSAPPDV
jgi:hypothetical protein